VTARRCWIGWTKDRRFRTITPVHVPADARPAPILVGALGQDFCGAIDPGGTHDPVPQDGCDFDLVAVGHAVAPPGDPV
jgi:hypothetical protein